MSRLDLMNSTGFPEALDPEDEVLVDSNADVSGPMLAKREQEEADYQRRYQEQTKALQRWRQARSRDPSMEEMTAYESLAHFSKLNLDTDLEGCRRITIVGPTGSGKTTLAERIRTSLAVPATASVHDEDPERQRAGDAASVVIRCAQRPDDLVYWYDDAEEMVFLLPGMHTAYDRLYRAIGRFFRCHIGDFAAMYNAIVRRGNGFDAMVVRRSGATPPGHHTIFHYRNTTD